MQLLTNSTPCRHRAALFVLLCSAACVGAIHFGPGGGAKFACLDAAIGASQILQKLIDTYPSPIPSRGWSGKSLARYTQLEIALGPAAKGTATMTRSARTATLVVLLCLPVLALSDLAAWAKHHRVGPYFSGPCPDRCKSTRLSICSACMGGIKTCAQQHVCSNNRSVVCGDESTVSVPCWNQRYRW